MTLRIANSQAKSASVYATVKRADGRIENLGLISYYHRNPILNWMGNRYIKFKGQSL